MTHASVKRCLRSLLAWVLALAMPLNAVAATLMLPAALHTVSAQAFENNTAVEEIVLPDGTRTIDSQAFAGCTALTRAVIPASVEFIAENAFEGVPDALFIDAPADSYAAAWARAHGYATNEAEPPAAPAELVEHAFWPVQYVNMGGVNWVADLFIENYDLREGEELLWKIERVDGNEGYPGLVVIDTVENGGLFAGLHMYKFSGETGPMTWRVTVESSMGDFSLSRDYEIEVVELPEGEGFDVGVPEETVCLNVGDTYIASVDDLYVMGEVPEDAQVSFCVMSGELEDYPTLVYTDTGFEVTFNEPGRYVYPVSITVNGLELFKEVYLVVGPQLTEAIFWPVQYVSMVNLDRVNWVADLLIENYDLREGEELLWKIERVDDNEGYPGLVVIDTVENGGLFAGLHMYKFSGETGPMTWRVTVESSMGDFSLSRDYEIEVVELPEGEGFDVGVPEETVCLNVGDTYIASVDDLYVMGEVPEDAQVSFCVMSGELEDYPTLVYTDTGFEVTINEPGTYSYLVSITVNGLELFKEVYLQVGPWLAEHAFWPIQYVNMGGVNWVADLQVENYDLREGEELLWKIERADENESNPGHVVIDTIENSGLFAGLHMYDFTGETGTMTWRVTVESSMGDFSLSREFNIEVIELPEGADFNVGVPEEVIYLNVGDTYAASADDLFFTGDLPEDAQTSFCVMPDELDVFPTLKYTDTGFEVTIDEPGRYSYLVSGTVNGLEIYKPVYLVVGSAESDEMEIVLQQGIHTAYTSGSKEFHIADAYLELPLLLPGEEVSWSYEQTGGNADESLTLILGEPYGDEFGITIHARMTGEAIGEYTFLLKAATSEGLTAAAPITLTMTEAPADLPTYLSNPLDTYHLLPGEAIYFADAAIEFGDGVVPADAAFSSIYNNTNELAQYGDVWWMEYGFEVSFDQEGSYTFEALAWINNVGYSKLVTLVVSNDNPYIHADQVTDTVFASTGSDAYVGSFEVRNLTLQPGETGAWSITREDQSPHTPFVLSLGDEYNDGLGINIGASEIGDILGTATYRLTYTASSGLVLYTDITLSVAQRPGDLPTALSLPITTYYLDPGASIELYVDDIDFANGYVPAWATVARDYWDLENVPQVEAFDGGVRLTFPEQGRYSITAYAGICNYSLFQSIEFVIGSFPELRVSQDIHTVYTNGSSEFFIGSVYANSLELEDGEEIRSWTAEQVWEGTSSPVHLLLDNSSMQGRQLSIDGILTGDATGDFTYLIEMVTTSGLTLTTELTITVADPPDNLPTALYVPQDTYEIDPGMSVFIGEDDIGFADGLIPAGSSYGYRYVYADAATYGNILWTDGGVMISFDNDGIYSIYATAYINNVSYVREIRFLVGDTTRTAYISVDDLRPFSYAGGQDSMHAASLWVQDYDMEDGDWYAWYIDPVDNTAAAPVALRVEEEYDNGRFVNLTAYDIGGQSGTETGTVTYRVTFCGENDFSISTDLTLTVLPMPDTLPTAIALPQTEYVLQAGEAIELLYDHITPANGEIPEDATVFYHYWNVSNLPGLEWTNDGFTARFDSDGRYSIEAALRINNYVISQPIYITVGNGAGSAYLYSNQHFSTIYSDGSNDEFYLGSFSVENYELLPGESSNWKLERIDGGTNPAASVMIYDIFNNGKSADLGVQTLGSLSGSVAYRLSFTTSAGLSLYTDITLEIVPVPDDLPTAVAVPATEYHLEIGESLCLYYDDITPANGVIPEDAAVTLDYYLNGSIPGVRWYQDYILIPGTQNGRYQVNATLEINNLMIRQPITITVGTGLPDSISLEGRIHYTTLYADPSLGANYIGWYYLNDYRLGPDEDHEWTLTYLNSDTASPIRLYTQEYDDGNAVDICVSSLTGLTGTADYRLTFTSETGITTSVDFTINVVELPDNLPTALTLPATEYHLDVGESLYLYYDDIKLADGELPEDAVCYFDYGFYGFDANTRWYDDGVSVSYSADGRYRAEAYLQINNYYIAKEILIIVGSGVSQNTYIQTNHMLETLYLDSGNNIFAGSFRLNNYTLLENEAYEWTITPLGDDPNPPVELQIWEIYNSGRNVSVGAYIAQATPCTASFRLSFVSESGLELYKDITISVVERPDNLPTALVLPATAYQLDDGDTLKLFYDDIGIADGAIPQDAYVSLDYWAYQNAVDTHWEDDGVLFSFPGEGRYTLYANMQINNCYLEQAILVTVGDGVPDSIDIDSDQFIHTVYAGSDNDTYIGCFELYNYEPQSNDYSWTLECLGDEETSPAKLRIAYEWGSGVDVNVYDVQDETGTVSYRLTFACGELEASTIITLEVVQAPADLPVALVLPAAEYTLNVGDTLALRYDDILFGEGAIPDDAYVFTDYWIHRDSYEYTWVNGGVQLTFTKNGTFFIYACGTINNYNILQPITLQVGEAAETGL